MSDKNLESTKSNHRLMDLLVNEQKEDFAQKRRFKIALATAIWLTLATIWFPGFRFRDKVVTLSNSKDVEPQRIVVLRPKPKEVIKSKPITKKKATKVPLPDLTPMEPELMVEPTEIDEVQMVETDTDFIDDVALPAEPPEVVYDEHRVGVESPVITLKVPPQYPRRALSVGIQGYVLLEAILGKDGTVREIKVLRGLGKGRFGFEDEARDALAKWQFVPGKVKGQPADIRMNLRITFSLVR